jgi:hypothetical protein
LFVDAALQSATKYKYVIHFMQQQTSKHVVYIQLYSIKLLLCIPE